jgi:hypothetical protein
MELKLEVGKRYKTRDGGVVEIVNRSTYQRTHPFRADNTSNYMADGSFHCTECDSPCDLIEEVKEEVQTSGAKLRFEVGKKYVDGEGNIHRVLCVDLKGTRPIVTASDYEDGEEEMTFFFTSTGSYYFSQTSALDLIAEYKEPQPPRKLYAYQVGDSSEIRFFQERLVGRPDLPRAPEYDLEIQLSNKGDI